MIVKVTSVDLPVDEKLMIRKQRILPADYMEETGKSEACASPNVPGLKRISVVTGTHGDELEGQYVCFELQRRVREEIGRLKGIVDVYPALNPLGIDSITRGIPGFDLDMNRIFPGREDGTMAEYTARGIVNDLTGSDVVLDIHASNIFLKEMPQVRINVNTKDTLVPLAKYLNTDFIWVHPAATVLEATLAHSLNSVGTPTLVVEMGVGMRVTKEYTKQLTDGIFCLMKHLGIWDGDVITPRKPYISRNDNQIHFLNATGSGIFVPSVDHCTKTFVGDEIGRIVNPLDGSVVDTVLSPCNGIVFTLREYPVVDEGSLIARLYEIKNS
ncbi:MAG: M14 family metallopeptidase [Lachnospiraceae bacterium]|nr:M14 family metallopeptidase [Lachnospiraceae bacterium]